MVADPKVVCSVGFCYTISRNRFLFDASIVTGSLEVDIDIFTALRAGSIRIIFHTERYAK